MHKSTSTLSDVTTAYSNHVCRYLKVKCEQVNGNGVPPGVVLHGSCEESLRRERGERREESGRERGERREERGERERRGERGDGEGEESGRESGERRLGRQRRGGDRRRWS